MTSMRHINAAASIIHHDGRVLVVLKSGWDQFCIPVTKIDAVRGENGTQSAARDIQEVLGTEPPQEPGLLLDEGYLETSLRLGETGHYHFQVYTCEVRSTSVSEGAVERWLTPDELLDPATPDISPTTRHLIKVLTQAALDGQRSFPPAASPARRTSTASVAIVRRDGATGPEWLAQYNERWGRYFLVGGHEEPGETTAQCLQRELHEELAITPDDFTASNPQLLTFTAWSTGSWQLTGYSITAFAVTLTEAALDRVSTQSVNRWLTAAEIHSERCTDGKLISPTMRRVLLETGDIVPASV